MPHFKWDSIMFKYMIGPLPAYIVIHPLFVSPCGPAKEYQGSLINLKKRGNKSSTRHTTINTLRPYKQWSFFNLNKLIVALYSLMKWHHIICNTLYLHLIHYWKVACCCIFLKCWRYLLQTGNDYNVFMIRQICGRRDKWQVGEPHRFHHIKVEQCIMYL